ncbi:MAG TPA: hypothetical protein VF101_09460 [Gaiellaceae bacterium]
MSVSIYRNESLVEMGTYYTDKDSADELVARVREKWALLREKDLAGDYPVDILVGSDNGETKVIEYFRWRSLHHKAEAEVDERCRSVQAQIDALTTRDAVQERYTQAIRGFNQNFPSIGGTELLKGVCSCVLNVDGLVEDFPLSVKNGIVLMHRSPGTDFDGDGKREMYLHIYMHGGELEIADFGPIRVSQNFDVPNNGIVKSNGEGSNDFPGTAIWRVGWKIQTPLGWLKTDPATPLVFGPATVSHYPPVGTHFHSSTGPVGLIHVDSGNQIGTLTPGELTAFDIVVTKDDEVFAEYPNRPGDILDVLAKYTTELATA